MDNDDHDEAGTSIESSSLEEEEAINVEEVVARLRGEGEGMMAHMDDADIEAAIRAAIAQRRAMLPKLLWVCRNCTTPLRASPHDPSSLSMGDEGEEQVGTTNLFAFFSL
jgi:hypothetical protein